MDTRQLLVLGATMLASLDAPTLAQGAKEPYVRVAEIEIDPAQLEPYKAAVKEQIEAAIRLEPGVLAFYSVSDKENPAHVFVFEMYADPAIVQACGGLRFTVSARRHRLQAPFGAPVSDGKNPVPNSIERT